MLDNIMYHAVQCTLGVAQFTFRSFARFFLQYMEEPCVSYRLDS